MRKIMLITGASTGIGAATARLAAQDHDLLLHYRSSTDAAREVAAACEKSGAQVHLVRGDVAEPQDIDRIFGDLDARFGRIDVLVNNAGIVDVTARTTDLTHGRLRRIFDVNVIGAMLVAQGAVTRMLAQGPGGAIVNLSSAAARLGSGGQFVDYAASKAAIDTFTKGLSDEVAKDGIRVLSVRPGIIDTPIHAKGGEPDRADRLAPAVPMGRKGTADEVARAILWLASDAASYITGTTLDVTGGR